MKYLIIILLTIFGLNFVRAQTPANTGGIQPPDVVKENFIKNHPNVTPNWSKDGDNFKATYQDPTSHKGALIIYDKKGEVIRSEFEIDNLEHPKSIGDYYKKNYPDEKYKVWTEQDHTGVKRYYIDRNNEIIRFDKNGNHITEKKK